MSDPVEPLVLDLRLGRQARPYSEVIEAWRTCCPRLPVWEEANARGFVDHRHHAGSEARVLVSRAGRKHLKAHRSSAPGCAVQGTTFTHKRLP
jgi:hypothetical protein